MVIVLYYYYDKTLEVVRMEILRLNLWDFIKYSKLMKFPMGRLATNYFFKVNYNKKTLMIWEIDYAINKEAYIKYIFRISDSKRFSRVTHKVKSEFDVDKFIYENEENEGFDLNMYGFTKKASNLIMTLNLDKFNKKDDPKIEFRRFIKGQDENLRCHIQNKVFYEENRIPLKAKDIAYECSRKAFIGELAFFVLYNGVEVGYGQVLVLKGKYTVANFGILDEFRGKGLGEALITYILNQAKNLELKEIYIKVKSNNTKAVNLYEKIGFKDYAEVKIYEFSS